MRRILFCLLMLLVSSQVIYSQTRAKFLATASRGGRVVRTSPTVQYKLMETYPACLITVRLAGSATLATLFTDEIGTAKSNPFISNSIDASFEFYVDVGRYDITFSGTGIAVPFTWSDVFISVGGGGGGSSVDSFEGRTGVVISQTGDYTWAEIDKTTSSLGDITTRSASDLSSGILPDARFPAILPAVSGTNLTNINASNVSSGTLDDARLSANIPKKNAINAFANDNYFNSLVGINTTTPRRRLDILDGSNAQLRLSAVDNSVYTDFFVDSGGSLNIQPTGNVAFNSAGKQVNPLNNFDQNLGQINKKYLSLHAAELFVETLVAQNTIATIGGRIIVAPSNLLIADLAPASGTMNVKYNNLANGDRVYMEGNSAVEFLAITSGATPITGGFSYTITRNLDGTGANQWFAGDALVNTGVAGSGFIDLYSTRGVKTSTQVGPTIVGNIRNSGTYNDWSESWAIGNLNGLYGYGSDIYGVALGKYAASPVYHLTIDPSNGIRIFDGLSTVNSSWDSNGITIGGVGVGLPNVRIAAGSIAVRLNTTERFKVNSDSSGFMANSLISWDASGNFSVSGNATIGGWSISSNAISSTGISIKSGAGANISLGSTPPISCVSGTGVFIDSTGLCSVNAGTQIAKTTNDGIRIFTLDGLKFSNGGADQAYIGATTTGSIRILSQPSTGSIGQILLHANEPVNNENVMFKLSTQSTESRATLFRNTGFGTNFSGLVIGADAAPAAMLDIRSDKIRISTAKTPASASEACTQGIIAWDSGFVYVCVATDTWKRAAIATW